MYSDELLTLIDEEVNKAAISWKQETALEMLKDNIPLKIIIRCLNVNKKFVNEIAKKNNLQVNDVESVGGDL